MKVSDLPEKESADYEIFFLMDRFGYTLDEATGHYHRHCEQRQLAEERAQAKLIKKAMLRKDQQNYIRQAHPERFAQKPE
jgi:hypothetical protein